MPVVQIVQFDHNMDVGREPLVVVLQASCITISTNSCANSAKGGGMGSSVLN